MGSSHKRSSGLKRLPAHTLHYTGEEWRVCACVMSWIGCHSLVFCTQWQQREGALCCVTCFRADICLIDDFVPHQSIMHNLTWIKSHINIITHWLFCIVWHASEEQNPSLRKSDRGDTPCMSSQTHAYAHAHTHKLYTNTHTSISYFATDVKMLDLYSSF